MGAQPEEIVRKRDTGEPGNPGQFGSTPKRESGLSLGAPDDRVEAVRAQAREQDATGASILLDPALTPFGQASTLSLEERAHLFTTFEGAGGPNYLRELTLIESLVADRWRHQHPRTPVPYLTKRYNSAGELVPGEVACTSDRYSLTVPGPLMDGDDGDLQGMAFASAAATRLNESFQQAGAAMQAARGPSMPQMRAAVQIADWKAAEVRVRFVNEHEQMQSGTIRSGTYNERGGTAPHGTPERETFVRLTMPSGVDRFVPFARVQGWVLNATIGLDH